MNTKLESYYLSRPEPYQSCLLALKHIILSVNPGIVHERKFQIPFFTYKGKKLGYLWLNRKKLMVGLCTDKSLLHFAEGVRPKDRYESFEVDPGEDLPVEMILAKVRSYLAAIDRVVVDQ
ncbi:MAG: hypothetical protein DI535_06210 [Citrobacter freundii]|nr:MAG: hypothetical protein DI535_06210 [Citrobacter freundii]